MSGPFTTREKEITHAIADIVASQTNVLPQTTVRGNTLVGDTSLPIASATGFGRSGYVHFFDNTSERMTAISDVLAGPVLSLDYGGYAAHGFAVGMEHAHLNGAVVATNLMLHRPIGIAPMLRLGNPVVCIWPRRKGTREQTVGTTISPLTIRVQVHLAIQQYEGDPIDQEAYNQIQQELCWDYTQQIENALNQNRHLNTSYNSPGNHAQGLGMEGVKGDFATSMWDVLIENVDIPQAIGGMDVIVRPRRYVREEPGS